MIARVRRVYLDQNAWIRLSRAHHGLATDEPTVTALEVVQESVRLGIASFPLSWIHYFETYRKRDPGARRRLGRFMAETSRFHTIAAANSLLPHEITAAVARLQKTEPPASPHVFGRGIVHAFGDPTFGIDDQESLRPLTRQVGGEAVEDAMELEMLMGPGVALPFADIAAPNDAGSQRQLKFELEVERQLAIHGRAADLANRIVLAQETIGLAGYVPENLIPRGDTNSGIPKARAFWKGFVLSMPAKGAITRMRMTAHQNATFSWHVGDLNDMMALGCAAAYCDIVVAEKKWGDVLKRDRRHLHAAVVTDVADLPGLLIR